MTTLLEVVESKSDFEKVVNNYIERLLEEKKIYLEKIFQQNSELGSIRDDYTQIYKLLDELKTYRPNHNLQKTLQTARQVQKEIDNSLAKLSKHSYEGALSLKQAALNDLKECLISLDKALEECENFINVITEIRQAINNVQLMSKITEYTSKKQLEEWVKNIELIAGEIEFFGSVEKHFPDLMSGSLNLLQGFANQVTILTKDKLLRNSTKENLRKRILYASTYMVRAIEFRREIDEGQSAEARAVERIQEFNETTEWLTVAKPEQPIDIGRLKERLERRGYITQISHSKPPEN